MVKISDANKYSNGGGDFSKKISTFRRNFGFFLIILVLFLGIGYSFLSTQLMVSGVSIIKVDKIPPTITYSVTGGSYHTDQKITITPEDVGTGIDYYHVQVYKDGAILNKYENLTTANHTVVLDSNGTYEIRTKAIDKFKNESVGEPNKDGWYYQTYIIDKDKPTLTISASSGNYQTSASLKITVADTGGSGLSSSNKYQYCLSTSNSSATGCTWTDYTSGTAFTISGTNTKRYLFVYPIKDNAGNINGSYTNNTTPYLIGTYVFDSTKPTLTISAASGNYQTSASIKITAADTGGSGLSSSNKYQYCLSTSNSSATGCTWTNYTSGTAFTISGTNTKRYLFVYPIKDNSGNINGSYTNNTTPYLIGTYVFDSTKPTLTISAASGNYQTSASIKITVADTGGSGLSSSNKYQYCLSTSNSGAIGCTWTAYSSGTAFTISGTNTKRYLFVYPVKDNSGNINGSYSNNTTPYLIGTYVFDSTRPTLTISVNGVTAKLTAADTGGSGLSSANTYKYCLSTSSSSVTGCTWTGYTSGTNFTLSGSGTRYLFVYPIKDNSGNVNDGKTFGTPYMIKSINICDIVTNYSYTGGEQIFNVKCPGYYKVETWGASGGNATSSSFPGGYGGYSVGILNLKSSDVLYINVGGKGTNSTSGKITTYSGGYNGGGNGYVHRTSNGSSGAGGGGATHVAKKSGLLSSLSSSTSDILIVAAGGGGAFSDTDGNGYSSIGGSGGGYIGNSISQTGSCTYTCNKYNYPSGGSQTSGGLGVTSWSNGATSSTQYVGKFGIGGTGKDTYGGGGGGYYGGASGQYTGGGGGSGYIGNPLLLSYGDVTKTMYCYNCSTSTTSSTKTVSTTNVSSDAIEKYAKSGNGYARITYLNDTPLINFQHSVAYQNNTAIVTGRIDILAQSLSNTNKYQYYLSTSSTQLVGGSWKNYVNGQNFTSSANVGVYYLWIYPIADNNGAISDGYPSNTVPYVLSEVKILPCSSTLQYSYTGQSQLIDDKNGNWRIKFLTSGTLTFNALLCESIDVFLVGGGSAAGGAGYTKTAKNIMVNTTPYNIVVGDGGTPSSQNGKISSGFGQSVSGGSGCNGGSGCGSPGYTGPGSVGASDGASAKGTGQGTTTREFGESTGALYAGGGGGGGGWGGTLPCNDKAGTFAGGNGGVGGGGKGAGGTNPCDNYASEYSCQNGTVNTGGGAGTGKRGAVQCSGGSGIVIIRNHR